MHLKNFNYTFTPMNQTNGLLLLFFFSATALAADNGIIELPDSYRTPLSDTVYDNNPEWRAEPENKNPWRKDEEEPIVKPRIKAKLFPQYNYDDLYYRDSVRDPVSNTLFDDETELERPVSNIFEYSF